MSARTSAGRRKRRRAAGRLRPLSVIPTAGMADIAFLLIVFFVVTTVQSRDRTSVELPDSEIRTGADRDAAMVVLANGDAGSPALVYKFSDGTSSTVLVPGPAAIRAEAAELIATTPDKVFQIKADADVPCEDVGRVLDALSSAGARKILMLTDPATKEGS